MFSKILVVITTIAILSGCATSRTAVDEYPVIVQSAATIAVERFIAKEDTEAERQDRAEKIHDVATRLADSLRGGVETTVAQLEEAARAEVPWDELSTAEGQLVDALIETVAVQILRKVEDEDIPISPEDRVRVAQVFEWIAGATGIE